MFTGSSHLRRYEQVATSRLVMSFYCIWTAGSDASPLAPPASPKQSHGGATGAGASIICLYGSHATLTHVQRGAKWRGEGVVSGGGAGTCWHQEGGTSERTAWPATSDEDAKAPSGWEHKLEFWILNFLIWLFISVPFIFWHGENLGRHVRGRISKSSFFGFAFFSFVCLFWSPPTFPPLSLIFISYVSGRQRSCGPLWAALLSHLCPPAPSPRVLSLVLSDSWMFRLVVRRCRWPMPARLTRVRVFRCVQPGDD